MGEKATSNRISESVLIALGIIWTALVTGAVIAYVYCYPVLLFACSIIFFYIIAVCMHELAHAVATVLLGGHVNKIQVGRVYPNQDPWKYRFLGFIWHIHSVPLSGLVDCSFYTTKFYRLKKCVLIAAGPMINLGVAVPCLIIGFTGTQSHEVSSLLIGAGFVNGYVFLNSANPMPFYYTSQSQMNDMRLFWKTLFYSKDEIQALVDNAVINSNLENDQLGAKKFTADDLLAKYESDNSRYVYLWYAVDKLHEVNDPRYDTYVIKRLQHPLTPEGPKEILIDHYLTRQLALGSPVDPDESDRLSLQLLSLNDSLSNRGTRGSVLVDLGRIEEGVQMLKAVLDKTESMTDKGYSNIFLAIAAKKQGDIALARKYAAEAFQVYPKCEALNRVTDLLPLPAA